MLASQSPSHQGDQPMFIVSADFQNGEGNVQGTCVEMDTRAEADDFAEHLREEGYHNVQVGGPWAMVRS